MTDSSNNNGDDFYKDFDQMSNGGKVYATDLSALEKVTRKRLTKEEKRDRRDWLAMSKRVRNLYNPKTKAFPEIETVADVLSQRVLIPCLTLGMNNTDIARRSGTNEERANNKYFPQIFEWDLFEQNVEAFDPQGSINAEGDGDDEENEDYNEDEDGDYKDDDDDDNEDEESDDEEDEDEDDEEDDDEDDEFVLSDDDDDNHFLHNFIRMRFEASRKNLIQDEDKEREYLRLALGQLIQCNLLKPLESRGRNTGGGPDLATKDNNGEPELIIEFEPTHNLPLPMLANRIVELYNSYGSGNRTDRIKLLRHPIGQLVAYMVLHNRRYGILTSGTRTYFLYIEQQDGESNQEILRISNAWFIGQKNFLRAWAYMSRLAANSQHIELTMNKSETNSTAGSKRPRGGDSGPYSGPRTRSRADDDCLPEIQYNSLEMIRPLGHGRCGTVILAEWQGREVALKHFDMEKNYESFEKEVAAYLYLKPAWGSLVVTPLFVCEHWYGWVKYIGFQLGREPTKKEVRPAGPYWAEREKVLDTLEKEYNFRHEDAADGDNMVYIWDEKTKTERLVAIDLEFHTILEP